MSTSRAGPQARAPGRGRRVVIADGVRLTRDGMGELLSANGIRTTLCGADPDEIVQTVVSAPADVVVLNFTTVDLVAATTAVRSVRDVPLIAVSVSQTVADVACCAELGLSGFVLADDSVADLLELIFTAEAGQSTCPPGAVPMLMQAFQERAGASSAPASLTARETEIAALLEEGLANKEIAQRLGIATRTVKNHLQHVYEKLDVHSRGELVARARD